MDRGEFARGLNERVESQKDLRGLLNESDEEILDRMFSDAWATSPSGRVAEETIEAERLIRINDIIRSRSGVNSHRTTNEPVQYLFGWPEILDALERGRDEESRIKRLAKEFDGPIIISGQGAMPKANRAKLLNWWRDLEDRWIEQAERERDRRATVAETYKHGRDAEVVPDIAGSVKRRRSNSTSQKLTKLRKSSSDTVGDTELIGSDLHERQIPNADTL